MGMRVGYITAVLAEGLYIVMGLGNNTGKIEQKKKSELNFYEGFHCR